MEEKKETHTLWAKLSEIAQEVGAVSKDGKNEGYGGGYNFIRYDEIAARVRMLFARNHLVMVPEIVEATTEKATTAKGGIIYRTVARVAINLYDGDSGEASRFQTYAEAADTGDKGINKCLTAAVKYWTMRTLWVSDSAYDDPDKTTPEETVDPLRDRQQALDELIRRKGLDLRKTYLEYGHQSHRVTLDDVDEMTAALSEEA